MADKKDKKKISNGQSSGQVLISAISAAVEKGLGNGIKSLVDAQDTTNKTILGTLEKISASQEELVKALHETALQNLEAAGDTEDVIEDVDAGASDPSAASDPSDASVVANASDPSMSMAKSDASDPTDDASDASDASDMDAESKAVGSVDPTAYSDGDQGDDAEPGNLNPKASSLAKSKARSGSTQMKPGGASSSPAIAAAAKKGISVSQINAAAKVIKTLQAERAELVKENKKLRNRVTSIEASLDRYADRVERKSISPEISALLEKSGYDARELMASNQRLTVNEVDQMFANSGVPLEPTMKAAFKNQLLEKGLMETGEVRRYN